MKCVYQGQSKSTPDQVLINLLAENNPNLNNKFFDSHSWAGQTYGIYVMEGHTEGNERDFSALYIDTSNRGIEKWSYRLAAGKLALKRV